MAMTTRGNRGSNQLGEWIEAAFGGKKKRNTGVNASRGAARKAFKGKPLRVKLTKGMKMKPGVEYYK